MEKFEYIKLPEIKNKLFVRRQPHILLRQNAGENNIYHIEDIIKSLASKNEKQRIEFIIEIAQNERLKNELSKYIFFHSWIKESEKIEFVEN